MIPSGCVNTAIENGPVEIVDLPNYKMVDLSTVFCMFTRGYINIISTFITIDHHELSLLTKLTSINHY